MNAPGHRLERLADQIRNEVTEMLEGELADPRIGSAMVTRVEVSPDYRHARVWVAPQGQAAAPQETLEGLASAAGYIRHALSQRLAMRRTPELTFHLDRGAVEAAQVERVIQNLHPSKA